MSRALSLRSAGVTARRLVRSALRMVLRSPASMASLIQSTRELVFGFPARSADILTDGVARSAIPVGSWPQAMSSCAQRMTRRHPPVPVRIVALEPEQQVGRLRTLKAFRTGRTCTMLSASHGPKGFKIRVERYSRSLSNTAGGAKLLKSPVGGAKARTVFLCRGPNQRARSGAANEHPARRRLSVRDPSSATHWPC